MNYELWQHLKDSFKGHPHHSALITHHSLFLPSYRAWIFQVAGAGCSCRWKTVPYRHILNALRRNPQLSLAPATYFNKKVKDQSIISACPKPWDSPGPIRPSSITHDDEWLINCPRPNVVFAPMWKISPNNNNGKNRLKSPEIVNSPTIPGSGIRKIKIVSGFKFILDANPNPFNRIVDHFIPSELLTCI